MQKSAGKNTKYSRNETILKIGHLAKAIASAWVIAFAKWSLWVKTYNSKKDAKNHSTTGLQLYCRKDGCKKHGIYSKNDKFSKIARIGQYEKAMAFAKWSLWVKNLNSRKDTKNDSTTTLQLFCAKNGSKKHRIFKNVFKISRYAFAKSSLWVKNQNRGGKCEKTYGEQSLSLLVFLSLKDLLSFPVCVCVSRAYFLNKNL